MELIGTIAATPLKTIWSWISESADQIASESNILAKGWHLFAILFMLCILVFAFAWFIVVKTTQITLVFAVGALSSTMLLGTDG